ncbi:hypothetical protein LUZ60_011245 [Juncus effusus]|nr:hypothetical protein LUZ60_011245 [Juncus effusus]
MGGGIAGGGGGDASSPATGSPSPTASGGGKRGRDPEDEVYIDNLHSSKRYLSEIMATSLNGLSFGDSIEEPLVESPQHSENLYFPRDEFSLQYSPMSEDSDETRFFDLNLPHPCHSSNHPCNSSSNNCGAIAQACNSSIASVATRRGSSDTEGRFPSSPNDYCHVGDLRRTALLRSVQMRAQPVLKSGSENGELEVSSEKSSQEDNDEEDII